MSGYALHPEAYNDIDDIREYIADSNPDAADRVVSEIFESIRALVPFPHQGFRRPNLTSRPLMRMQSAYDIARTRSREKEIRVRRFHYPREVHP